MNQSWRSTIRTIWTGIRIMVVFTILLGVVYPLIMTAIGQVVFPWQANGSTLTNQDGQVVGSVLIGQSFLDAAGQPLPQYFQPRPSAHDYDTAGAGASNLGPEDPRLLDAIAARRLAVAAFNGVPPADVPPDAVTASASGLDPDISPAYAAIQIARVAASRGLPVDTVTDLVARHTLGPDLGYLGQTRVNVVELNLALDQLPV